VITLAGEFDVVCADSFKRRFAEATEDEPEGVVIDLRELTFIDSTGIRILWQAHQRSAQDGTRLSVIPGNGNVSRALRITGLLDHMDLLDR